MRGSSRSPVLHADPEVAERAIGKIRAEWDVPEPAFGRETVHDYFVSNVSDGEVRFSRGDVAARRDGETLFEHTWRTPYKAHAPIETHCAVAEWKDGKVTVCGDAESLRFARPPDPGAQSR